MTQAPLLDRLAALRGVRESYCDYRGEPRGVSRDTRAGLLRAMGVDPDDESALEAAVAMAEAAHWRELLPRVAVSHADALRVIVNVPIADLAADFDCHLLFERGGGHRWQVRAADLPEVERGFHFGREVSRRGLDLPSGAPPGYHELSLAGAGHAGRCRVIMAPGRCYEPPALADGRRAWGVAVQLYTLRSPTNWGIGDFGDLEHVLRAAAAHGAAFVGLNPLHALFPARPTHCSPYSASSRYALNVLCLAVESLPEFEHCDAARTLVADPAFQARLARLRAGAHVDYAGVAAAKLEVLELLHRHFREVQVATGTARAAAFAAWRAERGRAMQLHALYDALDEHLTRLDRATDGWQSWPEAYRDPDSAEVAAFDRRAAVRVDFYAWLQWLADTQLAGLRQACASLGMTLGLYGDYAVGVNPGGSETWSDQATYRLGAGIGAPPDALALKGQDWGIPPQDPAGLAARAYEPFAALLRASMRHYGVLRLDHVMALFRQWWVPRGLDATEGGYVHYPLEDLVSIVALESVRNACLVVGEDLGVVPPEVSTAMAGFGLYHYKVVLFEKRGGRFVQPQDYLRRAIATLTTHDLPTLKGWWEGADLELRDRLDLYPDAATRARVQAERSADREGLLDALAAAGVRPRWPVDTFDPAFAAAVHGFLARTASALAVVQAEDLAGMVDPVNVPGTSTEHANWQRKMTVDVDGLFGGDGPRAILATFVRERGD